MTRILYREVQMLSPNEARGMGINVFVKVRLYAGYVGSTSGRVMAWTRNRRRAMMLDDTLFEKALAHATEQLAAGGIDGELGQEALELEPAGAA